MISMAIPSKSAKSLAENPTQRHQPFVKHKTEPHNVLLGSGKVKYTN
jgi:hypothetical protein